MRKGSVEVEEVASKATLKLYQGDQLHVFTAGGAGYGDPLDRDPDLVLQDVLDSRISPGSAKDDYGVVVQAELGLVNFKETGRVREQRKAKQGDSTWTFDLGPEFGRI